MKNKMLKKKIYLKEQKIKKNLDKIKKDLYKKDKKSDFEKGVEYLAKGKIDFPFEC